MLRSKRLGVGACPLMRQSGMAGRANRRLNMTTLIAALVGQRKNPDAPAVKREFEEDWGTPRR
jgi:hypothetical protein